MSTAQSILVVDDLPDQAQGMVDLLEALGHRAVAAGSATEAWKLLDASEKFSLILSDLRMPDVDGGQFCSALRHRFPGLPVILVTAFPFDSGEFPKHMPVLEKPISADRLTRAIAQYV